MKTILYDVILDDDRREKLKVIAEYDEVCIDGPEKAVNTVNEIFDIEHKAEEVGILLSIGAQTQIKGIFEISRGTARCTQMNGREIFMRLLMTGGVYFIVLHNHPSGIAKPSRNDIEICNRLKEAGDLIGIPLADFIITGDKSYCSFIQKGLLD